MIKTKAIISIVLVVMLGVLDQVPWLCTPQANETMACNMQKKQACCANDMIKRACCCRSSEADSAPTTSFLISTSLSSLQKLLQIEGNQFRLLQQNVVGDHNRLAEGAGFIPPTSSKNLYKHIERYII